MTGEEYLISEITRLVKMLEQDNDELHEVWESYDSEHNKAIIDSIISQNLMLLLNLDRIVLVYSQMKGINYYGSL